MTNLEFIEILIEENKKEIEFVKNMIAEDDKYPSIKKINEENLKSIEELLAHLQRVKTDLEAWEVVKSSISLSENNEDYKNRAYLNVINYNDKQWLILKKALEVENAN